MTKQFIDHYGPFFNQVVQSGIDLVHFEAVGDKYDVQFYNLRGRYLRAAQITPIMKEAAFYLKAEQTGTANFRMPKIRTHPDHPTIIYLGFTELDVRIESADKYWNLFDKVLICQSDEDFAFLKQIFNTMFPKDQITFEHLNDFTAHSIENNKFSDTTKSWCASFFDNQLYLLPYFSLRRWQAEGGAINIIFPNEQRITRLHVKGRLL